MRLLFLPGIALLAALTSGCGVEFRADERGTEFFTSLDISGETVTGESLTVLVGYEQYYPVDVEFICEVRRRRQLISVIGRDVVPALPGGNPDATPFPGAISFDFTVQEPGRYRVECLTEKDEDNFIAEFIEVEQAATAQPSS